MARKQVPKFRVISHSAEMRMSRIVDQRGNTAALVMTGLESDAHQMAAAPAMHDRLTEVRHLKVATDGKQRPLLPPEALAAIDRTLSEARGEFQ